MDVQSMTVAGVTMPATEEEDPAQYFDRLAELGVYEIVIVDSSVLWGKNRVTTR